MTDTPEILGLERAEPGAEHQDATQVAATLTEIAGQTGSVELAEIGALVVHCQEPGEAGVTALQQSINRLSDFDATGLAAANPETAGVAEQINQILMILMTWKSRRQDEINLYENARKVEQPGAPGLGETPELRAQAAREALQHVVEANSSLEQAGRATADAGQVRDPLMPQPDPVQEIKDNFGPDPGQTVNEFNTGFSHEAQLTMAKRFVEEAEANLKTLPEGQKVQDTVLAVLGNHPEVAREIAGFMNLEVTDADTLLRGSFTELAAKAGIDLPDTITDRLQAAAPNNPPFPG